MLVRNAAAKKATTMPSAVAPNSARRRSASVTKAVAKVVKAPTADTTTDCLVYPSLSEIRAKLPDDCFNPRFHLLRSLGYLVFDTSAIAALFYGQWLLHTSPHFWLAYPFYAFFQVRRQPWRPCVLVCCAPPCHVACLTRVP